ncbi:MAG: sigma-54 interaction domain-containing protein [Bradymonadia bacterium]
MAPHSKTRGQSRNRRNERAQSPHLDVARWAVRQMQGHLDQGALINLLTGLKDQLDLVSTGLWLKADQELIRPLATPGSDPIPRGDWTHPPKEGALFPLDDGGLVIAVPLSWSGQQLGALAFRRTEEEARSARTDLALLEILAGALAPHLLPEEPSASRRAPASIEPVSRPHNIIGNSKIMAELYGQIDQVADSDTTVLIRGESGTGKELVAEAIHQRSNRSRQPFIKVNCAALPQTLLESELFGHEKGAFTGALNRRKGRFELADGGTLFLDEVGDLPPHTQVALLRVLQSRSFERIGGTETLKVDVRLIAATNQPLENLITDGDFREDLYYRLNVFPLYTPSLRERRSDILLLADSFLERYARANNKIVRRISMSAIDVLLSYSWPGNVRELENCIERAVLVTRDQVIRAHDLPPSLQTADTSDTLPRQGLKAALEALEKEMLTEALKSARGNMAKAARALGISERIMGLRVQKYKLDRSRFRTFS